MSELDAAADLGTLVEEGEGAGAQGGEKFARVPVARGAPPNRESIRFQAQASLAFKGADLERVTVDETIEPDDSEAPQKQWQMLVNSFGLFGSNGVLPYHISELVIQRWVDGKSPQGVKDRMCIV